jgi:hypothetical protein
MRDTYFIPPSLTEASDTTAQSFYYFIAVIAFFILGAIIF